MSAEDRKAVPAWSTWIEAATLIGRGVTFATAVRVAAVVGTLLSVVNQGAVIAAGNAASSTWIRVGVNYLVPYVVSSIGYLAPFRVRPRPRQRPDGTSR